jgi:hypothetical protein
VFPTFTRIAVVAALVLLSACGRGSGGGGPAGEAGREEEAGYLAPPLAVRFAGGELSGSGAPGARVRLASPDGAAQFADVAADGNWRLRPRTAGEPRIYGLSMNAGGRQVQSPGYVLIAPGGAAALLRAGGGSMRLDPQTPGMGTVDFDRGGGAVVSGVAPAEAVVVVRLDGRQVAEGRASAAGRFSIALPPLGERTHRLQVFGDGFQDEVTAATRPAAPLVDGPLRSQFTAGGLRADWLTPGGGVQSTLLTN